MGDTDKYIYLPSDVAGKCAAFSIDFGSTCLKLAYQPKPGVGPEANEGYIPIILKIFTKTEIDAALENLREHCDISRDTTFYVTGLNGHNYLKKIQNTLGAKGTMVGEVQCFIQALTCFLKTLSKKELFQDDSPDIALMRQKLVDEMKNFRITMAKDTILSWGGLSNEQYEAKVNFHLAVDETEAAEPDPVMFPCLVAMLGSASGFIQVNKDGTYSMKDGTTRCGRTLLGLARLALGTETFDDFIKLAEIGDTRNVDQCVEDLIDFECEEEENGMYSKLPRKLPFFTMGKVADHTIPLDSFRKEDIAKSLTTIIAGELAMNTYHIAMQHDCKTVLICGNLVNAECIKKEISRTLSRRALASQGEFTFRYYFLKHGGFYGALGALLDTVQIK